MVNERARWLPLGFLLLAACAHGPSQVHSRSKKGHVGPIAVAAVARLLVENRGDHIPVPRPPFFLAVSPLTKPTLSSSQLVCEWSDAPLPRVSYVPSGDDDRIEADLERVEQVVWINPAFEMRVASIDELGPKQRAQTLHVAYLCSDGDRVAVMVGYVHDVLSGFGAVVVLRRLERDWQFVDAFQTWEA